MIHIRGEQAHVILTSGDRPEGYTLDRHTAPIVGVLASLECSDLVTISANEAFRWTFSAAGEVAHLLRGLTSTHEISGLQLPGGELLLFESASNPDALYWDGRIDAVAPTAVLNMALSKQYLALLDEENITLRRRTAAGVETYAVAHNMPEEACEESFGFEPENERLLHAGESHFFWVSDSGIEAIKLPGLAEASFQDVQLADDKLHAFYHAEGNLFAWSLTQEQPQLISVPALPQSVPWRQDLCLQHQTLLACSQDLQTVWVWHIGEPHGRLIELPHPLAAWGNEDVVAQGGNFFTYVSGDSAYVLDLRAPHAEPIRLPSPNPLFVGRCSVAFAPGGTAVLLSGSDDTRYYFTDIFELSAAARS